MRTKGTLVVHGITGKSAVAAGDVGQTLFQLSARGVPEDIQHAVAAWNAVEAIGGNPAAAPAMAEALRQARDWGVAVMGTLPAEAEYGSDGNGGLAALSHVIDAALAGASLAKAAPAD
jgi:hypothetical protein